MSIVHCEQGYLVELADDMKSYVASLIPLPVSISVENQSELGGSSHLNLSSIVPSTYINKRKVSWWTRLRRRIQQKHKRVAKYGKWLAVQILLFAINFGQNELVCK